MKINILLLLGLFSAPAFAATVQQSGTVTPNHQSCWVTDGFIKDCGVPPTNPYLLATAPLTLADAATVTPDLNQAVTFVWTIGATGRTLANPANLSSVFIGQRLILYLIQGSGGSKTITTYGSAYKFVGGTPPTLSTAASAIDRLVCEIYSTTIMTCTFNANFQ